MAFSDFNLESAVTRLGLTLKARSDLFDGLEPVEVPPLIQTVLERWAPQALEVNTEKARSELIIAPILMEASHLMPGHLPWGPIPLHTLEQLYINLLVEGRVNEGCRDVHLVSVHVPDSCSCYQKSHRLESYRGGEGLLVVEDRKTHV